MGLFSISLPEPEPQTAYDPNVEVARWSQHIAAWDLAAAVSDDLRMPIGLVWDALCTVPDNMLSLLDSPQGWTALAGYIAAELGCRPPSFMPAVH